MDYWAIVFFGCAVVTALFAFGSITNSVMFLSQILTLFFLILSVASTVYHLRHR